MQRDDAERMERLHFQFDAMDTNRDGVVDRDEYIAAMDAAEGSKVSGLSPLSTSGQKHPVSNQPQVSKTLNNREVKQPPARRLQMRSGRAEWREMMRQLKKNNGVQPGSPHTMQGDAMRQADAALHEIANAANTSKSPKS